MNPLDFKFWLEASKKGDTQHGASIFFTDGKSFLALKAPKSEDGRWQLPGGHAKKNENALETAKREAKEECGYNQGKNIGTIVQRGGEWTSFIFLVNDQFKPKLSDEHEDYRWVPFTDVDKFEFRPKTQAVLPQHIDLVRKSMGSKHDVFA